MSASMVICHCVIGLMGTSPNPDCRDCQGSGEVEVVDETPMTCTQCHLHWSYVGEPAEGEIRDNLCPGCGSESVVTQ